MIAPPASFLQRLAHVSSNFLRNFLRSARALSLSPLAAGCKFDAATPPAEVPPNANDLLLGANCRPSDFVILCGAGFCRRRQRNEPSSSGQPSSGAREHKTATGSIEAKSCRLAIAPLRRRIVRSSLQQLAPVGEEQQVRAPLAPAQFRWQVCKLEQALELGSHALAKRSLQSRLVLFVLFLFLLLCMLLVWFKLPRQRRRRPVAFGRQRNKLARFQVGGEARARKREREMAAIDRRPQGPPAFFSSSSFYPRSAGAVLLANLAAKSARHQRHSRKANKALSSAHTHTRTKRHPSRLPVQPPSFCGVSNFANCLMRATACERSQFSNWRAHVAGPGRAGSFVSHQARTSCRLASERPRDTRRRRAVAAEPAHLRQASEHFAVCVRAGRAPPVQLTPAASSVVMVRARLRRCCCCCCCTWSCSASSCKREERSEKLPRDKERRALP